MSLSLSGRFAYEGLTFDDVLLEPAYSELLPGEVEVHTQLTRNIPLNVPVVSSPMDTVTESEMAIALAQEGGIGIIHKNLPPEQQALEVDRVKRSEHGVIVDPVTLPPDAKVAEARRIMTERNIGGVPITENGKLRGILTKRDLRFLESGETRIAEVMTRENLVTAPEETNLEDAQRILLENKVEKLLLVDDAYQLKGLITIKDIDKNLRFPKASKDVRGRLRVGAAVGVHDFERAGKLIEKGVDVLVVDSAHGHSRNVLETLRELKRSHTIDVIAGNVATARGAADLLEAGADAVKVGIGPGSICTTRVVAGVGVPQVSAIANAVEAVKGTDVPIIADGGIRYSGDGAKALAAGAHSVMLGGLLAGLEESPGEMILFQGRTFKRYRGMGSMGAMAEGSSERYRQSVSKVDADDKPRDMARKLVPEGVEGRVAYKGPLATFLFQFIGGLRGSMGYLGCRTVEELRTKPKFIKVSPATVRENHPHDITITQESPNYTAEYSDSIKNCNWLGVAIWLLIFVFASKAMGQPPALPLPPAPETPGGTSDLGLTPIGKISPTEDHKPVGIAPLDLQFKGLPKKRALPQTTTERFSTPQVFAWEASNLYYHPLYFEDAQLERYGHTYPLAIQPAVSVARFGGQFLTLPYHMGMHPPRERRYPLGYYRPGECAPMLHEGVILDGKAGLIQGAAVVGAVFLIP